MNNFFKKHALDFTLGVILGVSTMLMLGSSSNEGDNKADIKYSENYVKSLEAAADSALTDKWKKEFSGMNLVERKEKPDFASTCNDHKAREAQYASIKGLNLH